MQWFADAAYELGPAYRCILCERSEKDVWAQPFQCPRCKLSKKLVEFKRLIIKEVLKWYGKFPDGWPLDTLLDLHDVIAQKCYDAGLKVMPEWDLMTAGLAAIFISEQQRYKRIIDWNYQKKIEAANKSK